MGKSTSHSGHDHSAKIPSASTQNDDVAFRMERIERLSNWLDSAIRVPGIGYKFGWDSIIGLFPGIGDVVTTMLSAWIINEARHLGASKITLVRMIANTSVDALVGVVPAAGDLFDAAFKSNVKNLDLLRKSLRERGVIADDVESAAVRVVGQSQG